MTRDQLTFQPRTSHKLKLGAAALVSAIRPTLGPLPRYVAIQDISGKAAVELLDDGGLIARRIIEIVDRDADVGAMFLRGVLWRLHEEVGDGTATAAVLFQSVFDQALRYIAAGGSAMLLRHYLERGMRLILDHLKSITCPFADDADLQKIAHSLCPDAEIAEALHRIFKDLGVGGRLDFRAGYGHGVEWEFVEGSYWKADVHSRQMLHAREEKTLLENCVLLVTDLELADLPALIEFLKLVLRAGNKTLLIIAKSLSSQAIAFLNSNSNIDKFQGIAVHTPGQDLLTQKAALEDIAMLSGARPFFAKAGDTLNNFTINDLGWARRVWVGPNYFGIIEGGGEEGALQKHICSLKKAAQQSQTRTGRELLQKRAAGLMDKGAVLWVGGASDTERVVRQQLAERSASLIRAALTDGVLPGAGVSLLASQAILQDTMKKTSIPEERAAYQILIRALEEPCRALAENAGYEASAIIAQLQRAKPGIGFDVRRGTMVDVAQAGIVDVAAVTKGAVRSAIASAALALTIDTIVHRKKRLESATPD